MAPRKPKVGNCADATPNTSAEDERQMFEREFAGVKPWRRGTNRISSVDFLDKPGLARPVIAQRSAGKQAGCFQVEADGVTGMAFGVSKETVSSLRHGEFELEARCDLHGLHAEPARRKLVAFVQECVRRKLRAGLVICGRGLHSGPEGPVLAKVVTEVLAYTPASRHILAFAPTVAAHGGPGAIAVLFRRGAAAGD